jgi:hypothetical protein
VKRAPRGQIRAQRQPGLIAIDLVVPMDNEVAVCDGKRHLDSAWGEHVERGQPAGYLAEFHHQ